MNTKELAYLYDLYVAPDWNERFAALIDEHVALPERGRVLYIEAGTGGHVIELSQRAGLETEVVATDSDAERLALGEAKTTLVDEGAMPAFRPGQPDVLPFDDSSFDVVIANASLVAPELLPDILREMTRVAAPGATIAVAFPSYSSFGEFYSIYWEALASGEDSSHAGIVESLIAKSPSVAHIEQLAAYEGLDEIQTWTNREDFEFASGEEFLQSPLIQNFLSEIWLEPLPDDDGTRDQARANLINLIDDERADGTWLFSIKATLLSGKRGE